MQITDYVETRRVSATETRTTLRLSADGNLLPRAEVAQRQLDPDAAVCLDTDTLEPAAKVIEFKIQMADNDPFVFAREIDAVTGKIEVQVEGIRTTGPSEAVDSGMRDAWGKLEPTLGVMTNGVVQGG